MIDVDQMLARVRRRRDTDDHDVPAPRAAQAAALAALIRPADMKRPGS